MKKKLSFEEAMKQLEETVDRLAAGNLPLDDMLKLYNEGDELSKYCLSLLEKFDADVSRVEKKDEKHDEKEGVSI